MTAEPGRDARSSSDLGLHPVLYIVAFALFIYGLHELRDPRTAVRGNRIAAVGMAIAVVATLLLPEVGNWGLIVLGVALGTAVGVPAARSVKMTAMPQMVALFNGVGGGAVALISWAEFRQTAGYGDDPSSSVGDPHRCSRRSSARSPSGARTSPSASSRRSSPAGRSRSARPAGREPGAARAGVVLAVIDSLAGSDSEGLFIGMLVVRGAARQLRRAADRRRRHAGRDLAAQRLHRPVARRRRASRSTTRR